TAAGFIAATYVAGFSAPSAANGLVMDGNPKTFINAVAQHRFWEREQMSKVPA
ncbi:MAG: hypothetical protein V4658_07045, partial [Bacteroidota bacterium]